MRISAKQARQQGFSLVEIAIVLIIVGAVATGSILGLEEYRSVQQVKEGEQKIENLREQLLLFGQINKFLPCPDTNFDGFEDRTGTGALFPCSKDVGTAPYIDLGLQRDDVQDAWGSFIRYAVNSDADNATFICDKTSSASYFCKSGFGINWFTFTETPPFLNTPASGVGGGNYYVCNSIPNACNASTVMDAVNLEAESASVVLVAYNEDGHRTLANCGSSTGLNAENCDTDEFYQQGIITSEEGVFFDDMVRSINGYEIKRAMLGQTVVWDAFSDIAGQGQLEPTYEDFDITSSDTLSEIGTTGDDIVFVRRNVDTTLALGAGDDYISIGNDLNSTASYLYTGSGNDTVYIVGQANSRIYLGGGDDIFVLATDLTNLLDADAGNDKVWIQGAVTSSATFILGSGDDVVWLGQSSDLALPVLESGVGGGTGYDILVLENMTKAEWDTDGIFQSYVYNFELVLFKADATGTREYVELP